MVSYRLVSSCIYYELYALLIRCIVSTIVSPVLSTQWPFEEPKNGLLFGSNVPPIDQT